MKIVSQMTWHHSNGIPKVLWHPSDDETWKHFDQVYLDFAADLRNVRLGLYSDGFTPYIQASTKPYSYWPVIKSYMLLTCLIPGLSNPNANIDMFLQPLIDDLKSVWIGEWT